MLKVSCVMPTYRRFTCVERSITFFLSQKTEIKKELIICNTDVDHPLVLDNSFSESERSQITIINNNIDQQTQKPYSSTGAIRRDGLALATGNYHNTWDDDDIYFPWHIQQCYDGLLRTNAKAWKPYKSFILLWGKEPTIEGNYLESTIMMDINEVYFTETSGPEAIGWFHKLKDQKQLIEDEYSIPAYCFYWFDNHDVGGQKQSGNITDPNNFIRHMESTTDYATRPLTRKKLSDYADIFKQFDPILETVKENQQDLFEKYVTENYYNTD